MATRKQKRHRSLIQFLTLLVAVVIVLVAIFLGQRWWQSRPGPDPHDVAVAATVGSQSQDVLPYTVCELGADCPEGEIARVPVPADGELQLKIPKAINDHDWQLLLIYDDPAANDQRIFGAHEEDSVTVRGSVDPVDGESGERPKLMVVEVHSMMIGTDADGAETPVAAVWSLNTASN